MPIKATYVWVMFSLPVVITTLNKSWFKDDGYIVNYDVKNNPNKRTKDIALGVLKTSREIVRFDRIQSFSLGKGEEEERHRDLCAI